MRYRHEHNGGYHVAEIDPGREWDKPWVQRWARTSPSSAGAAAADGAAQVAGAVVAGAAVACVLRQPSQDPASSLVAGLREVFSQQNQKELSSWCRNRNATKP